MRMILRHYVCSARRKSRRCPGMSFLVRSLQATGMALSWFHGTNGKPTFHRLANLSWLFEICNHFGDIAAWSPKSLKTVAQIAFFEKKSPYRQIYINVFQKDSWRHRSTSCVQFSWNLADRKSVKLCVIYLTKKLGSLSRSHFCADSAQNLTGPAPDNILGVSQISSESVHLRWL